MILFIGGESHTGKTLLMQALIERYHMPAYSLDHIKMGLFRGKADCGFSPTDSDEKIAGILWPIVKGIADTCLENEQHLILEGCYLPQSDVADYVQQHKDAHALYLAFSDSYIQAHFNEHILQFESAIEQRVTGDYEQSTCLTGNRETQKRCFETGLPCYVTDDSFSAQQERILRDLDRQLLRLRAFRQEDIDAILRLFGDTVRTVCRKDYTAAQTDAWANSVNDRARWERTLSEHKTLVAVLGARIVGFADLDGDYLDRLYVHRDFQGRGIGTALLHELEAFARQQKISELETHASRTAKPFFAKQGFRLVQAQTVVRDGETLENFVMRKVL